MENKQLDIVRRFKEFEVCNKLFELTDNNGVYIWDIVRFQLEYSLVWSYAPANSYRKYTTQNIIEIIRNICRSLSLLCSRKAYRTLSIKASRNKLNGLHFDQNQHDAVQGLNSKEIVTLETYSLANTSYVNNYPYQVIKLYNIIKKSEYIPYDFNPILSMIKEVFPTILLTNNDLNATLKIFYAERNFYRYFLKCHSIKEVFFTQNGIMKGLLAAAKEFSIPTYEFQHGIVNEKHFAYSYPSNINVEYYSYQPTKLLRLSDYWFSDFYAPFDCATIGNNYFSADITPQPKEDRALLVISTNAFGEKLSDDILKVVPSIQEWTIYYKLHPNEFDNIKYYNDKFINYDNIMVISNEYDVNLLLNRCSTMLTFQSTAIYEALQGGRIVIIIDQGEYNEIHGDNIYHIDQIESLKLILNQKKAAETRTIFFEEFRFESFLNAIKQDYV